MNYHLCSSGVYDVADSLSKNNLAGNVDLCIVELVKFILSIAMFKANVLNVS